MIAIQAPTHCPSCESELEWSNHLLYCRNPSCGEQASKKIEHFAKTIKIKGLGPSTISKLNMLGIEDIYTLTVDVLENALSSIRIAEKLISEIENSKKAPLNLVLPAFSIPLIGRTAARKLATVCDSIFDINDQTCAKAGLGPAATANLLDWLNIMWPLYESLPLNLEFEKPTATSIVKGIVCISGKLVSFKTKAEATEALMNAGYTVKGSLTKDVTILVNESGIESAKTKQAQSKGILIVDNLHNFLGEQ
jgi:DNA ligase (NAD+)